MLKVLEDALYVFADLTRYYRGDDFPNGFGMLVTSGDRTTGQQRQLGSAAVRDAALVGPDAAIDFDRPQRTGRGPTGIALYTGPGSGFFPLDPGYSGGAGPLMAYGPYPVAPVGTSQHEYGAAFDAVPIVPESKKAAAQQIAGRIAAQVGLVWGSSADPVHFALFPRQVWSQILPAVRQGISSRELTNLWLQLRGSAEMLNRPEVASVLGIPIVPRPLLSSGSGNEFGFMYGHGNVPDGYIGQVTDPDSPTPG